MKHEKVIKKLAGRVFCAVVDVVLWVRFRLTILSAVCFIAAPFILSCHAGAQSQSDLPAADSSSMALAGTNNNTNDNGTGNGGSMAMGPSTRVSAADAMMGMGVSLGYSCIQKHRSNGFVWRQSLRSGGAQI